jgi:hypothetical protein
MVSCREKGPEPRKNVPVFQIKLNNLVPISTADTVKTTSSLTSEIQKQLKTSIILENCTKSEKDEEMFTITQ